MRPTRLGEQAALGADILALMDALHIEQAVLGGWGWGGRSACIVSALWPGGSLRWYPPVLDVQDIARAMSRLSVRGGRYGTSAIFTPNEAGAA